ncbi:MAG: hypothetical protein JSV41_08465 [Gemmatimonadota bacterium]|nr:MAG: hypothetical protein JSV41_08465 [Gemmatimonadota bacterium]
MTRAVVLVLLILLVGADTSQAQLPTVRGYYLNVGLWSDSTLYSTGGLFAINRLRVMTRPAVGPVFLDIAYEHVFSWSERSGAGADGNILAVVAGGGGEWAGLSWTLEDSRHVSWRHRFDRLSVGWSPIELLEITVGRQTISWATTLLLTPADPFVPFDPSDPFREYRAGVDALRVQVFPSPLSELDFVLRPTKTELDGTDDETLTLLARGRTTWKGWEISAWAGALHDEPAAAVGTTGGIGSLALRGEASLREHEDDMRFRGTVGIDTRTDAFDRDLYLVFEYQHDGFGASSTGDLARVIPSEPFARGELQTLGRDVAVGQASYQLHPLLGADLLVLWNLNDGSALLAPGASYSATNEATARAGVFLGIGSDDSSPEGFPRSEFGPVSVVLYASLSLFF